METAFTDAATISADGVYFIPQGVEAVISSTDFNKLVLISDNPKGEPVVVDNTNLFNATGTAGEFIAQNVIFKNANISIYADKCFRHYIE